MTAPAAQRRRGARRIDTSDGTTVVRFDRAERLVHWISSPLILVAAVTGAILYIPDLSAAVGRRDILKNLHVYAGLASMVPVLVAMAGPWRAGIEADIARFANWHLDDRRWFRRRGRLPVSGKFNGGQKANAIFVGAAMLALTATGSIMFWFGLFPLSFRTGATFVHDSFAIALWASIAGHIAMSLIRRGSIRTAITGMTPIDVARSRPRWWSEIADEVEPPLG